MKYQQPSLDIWGDKYQLKAQNGNPVDKNIGDTFNRVAESLSSLESTPELQTKWHKKFLWALNNGAVPAGRIVANAGAQEHKPATSTINCTVSGIIKDSMQSILGMSNEAGMTLKSGCGIGYEFSTIRPKGAFVAGSGSTTSGPLPFMDIYDQVCKTISSAGGRRGAQMATFDVSHPDVQDFISAKREKGRLRQFNFSLLITKEFIEAVKNDGDWDQVFPLASNEPCEPNKIVWRKWPVTNDSKYTVNNVGQVACKVYKTVKARELWDQIMSSTYDYAEPGFILIDKVNEMNNNWFCEDIRATNPCGEQPLPPYGACLLGSINLTNFVKNPFTKKAEFNWKRFIKIVRIFTRMLDNVVEESGLPHKQQQDELIRKRRHGMGYFGLGSAMNMLCMAYGSEESLRLTDKITSTMAITGWEESISLSHEKGPAPIMEEVFIVTEEMMASRPEMAKDGIKVGDQIKGKVLHARYSRYMQQIAEVRPDLIEKIAILGARFTHHTSIAPTGTIALSFGNNASNGIEPSFSHSYMRNVIREGKKTKEQMEVVSFELLAYRKHIDKAATQSDLPEFFMTADEIPPKHHVDVQAAAQRWVDSSISKTINVPSDYPYEDFKNIYLYAVDNGLKGCTTFRFNPEAFQGVMVKSSDLQNTTYKFVLEDGSEVTARGDEEIEYDGEIHVAANLFDAIKEGIYGTF